MSKANRVNKTCNTPIWFINPSCHWLQASRANRSLISPVLSVWTRHWIMSSSRMVLAIPILCILPREKINNIKKSSKSCTIAPIRTYLRGRARREEFLKCRRRWAATSPTCGSLHQIVSSLLNSGWRRANMDISRRLKNRNLRRRRSYKN